MVEAHKGLEHEVYLDLENSSPLPKKVVEAMVPYFSEKAYGNPTITHKLGWMAYEEIQKTSAQIAHYIGADSVEEVNFTPGEVEANNLALLGTVLANRRRGNKVLISEIAPLSIVFPSKMLEKLGFTVEKIPVDREGFLSLDALRDAADQDTILVSAMLANNEIGTIEPIKAAVTTVKEKNPDVLFHADASDAYGRIPLDVNVLGVDLLTLSSYKILGPRGVGALYTREGVQVERLLEGQIGTQKLWPGVENTPLIVGFREASNIAFQNFTQNTLRMRTLRDQLINGVLEEIPDTILNGPRGDKRAPDNVNISFLYCEGESLTIELSLTGVYVSSGSACTRAILQPSHVLTGIGRKAEEVHGSLLMKITCYHTDEDLKYVLKVLPNAVQRLRSMSAVQGGSKPNV
ncbi:MAG: cysteine desulfurase [Candidatus Bathyarchaeota archaeon]|nr:MAG: cysteine desulfurase [Candidatus Bathyarchaeota archaeon]